MKDINIKAKTIKKELWIFLVSILIAFGMNIYAIIKYNTEWSELTSKIHIVILLGLIIYFILLILRGAFLFLKKLGKR